MPLSFPSGPRGGFNWYRSFWEQGGVLVTIGLIGGGVEVREFKIPSVGRTARVLAFFGGVAFILLALFSGREPGDKSFGTSAGSHTETCAGPMYGGARLDACYEWGKRCGEEP